MVVVADGAAGIAFGLVLADVRYPRVARRQQDIGELVGHGQRFDGDLDVDDILGVEFGHRG